MCDCMDPAIRKLSPKARKLISKAFKEKDAQTVLQQELLAIEDEGERSKLAEEFTKAGSLMQGSKMRTCLEDVDKKYRVRKSQEKEMQEKLIEELENQCSVGADIFKYSLKYQDGAAGDDNTKE